MPCDSSGSEYLDFLDFLLAVALSSEAPRASLAPLDCWVIMDLARPSPLHPQARWATLGAAVELKTYILPVTNHKEGVGQVNGLNLIEASHWLCVCSPKVTP